MWHDVWVMLRTSSYWQNYWKVFEDCEKFIGTSILDLIHLPINDKMSLKNVFVFHLNSMKLDEVLVFSLNSSGQVNLALVYSTKYEKFLEHKLVIWGFNGSFGKMLHMAIHICQRQFLSNFSTKKVEYQKIILLDFTSKIPIKSDFTNKI